MGLVKRNFEIDQGTTWNTERIAVLAPLDPDSPISDSNPYVAKDLTGCTAKAQFRREFNEDVAVLTLTDTDGLVIDGPAGTIDLPIQPAQTTAISFRGPLLRLYYDLELTDTDGGVIRIAEGVATIRREITR